MMPGVTDRKRERRAIHAAIVPVDDLAPTTTDAHADAAADHRDERGFDHHRPHDRARRDSHEPQRRDVATAFVDLEQHDAEQKDRARDDRDDADRAMKAADDEKRARRLDGDVARPIGAETERRRVDAAHRAVRRGG